jgi:hypothetical protein
VKTPSHKFLLTLKFNQKGKLDYPSERNAKLVYNWIIRLKEIPCIELAHAILICGSFETEQNSETLKVQPNPRLGI